MTEQEFDALYRRYRLMLVGYVRKIVGNDRAEDVVQVTFMRAWVAAQSQVIRNPKPWLFEIARNTAVNVLRRRDEKTEALGEWMSSSLNVEQQVEDRDRLHRLLGQVTELPTRQRDALILYAGHSRLEVAAELGLTDGATRQLIYRARQAIAI